MKQIGSLAREIVVRAITECPDPALRKERVLIAREHGLLTEEEAADLIGIFRDEAA